MGWPPRESAVPRNQDGAQNSFTGMAWDWMATHSRAFQNLIHLVPARHLTSQRLDSAIIDDRKITFTPRCVKVVPNCEGSHHVVQE